MSIRDLIQEGLDLGISGFLFRSLWELKMRSGWIARFESKARPVGIRGGDRWYERAPFATPGDLSSWARASLDGAAVELLRSDALNSLQGDLKSFGRWRTLFGKPINWHRDPVSGKGWPASEHWSRALRASRDGDIKFAWEVARFPHAYWLARAAATNPDLATECAEGLAVQIRDFRASNPYGRGIHWSSGLEIALRSMSWIFAASVFGRLALWNEEMLGEVATGLLESATHIEKYFSFAQRSVNNDHLVGEATALLIVSILFPEAERASVWRKMGEGVLSAEAERQFDRDGGYFMASHNYHRSVLQYYVWASRFVAHSGSPIPNSWTTALSRSLAYLLAHLNPGDGRLPNSGSNDGGLPAQLATCDYSDFRPVLQAVSLVTGDERVFDRGPWDEESMWLFGTSALQRPAATPEFRSAAFLDAGSFVLRAKDPSTFATFRCGTVRNRFPQIDMLHVDFWWRGQNVLVDGGTFRYNGAPDWHRYFYGTGSHNTLTIDGADQMRHHRQFRVIYWTKARLRKWADSPAYTYASGEHRGYARLPGGCVHHRSVLLLKSGVCIVYDVVTGTGMHALRLQWQGGDFPYSFDDRRSMLTMHAATDFVITMRDLTAAPVAATVKAGATNPIRGWMSRYYGEKIAVPSLVAESASMLPAGFLTVLSGDVPTIGVINGRWQIDCGGHGVGFSTVSTDADLSDITVNGKET